MDIKIIEKEEDIGAAAVIAMHRHERLRKEFPFLPARTAGEYGGKIRWMKENGVVLGSWKSGRLAAFMGGFLLEDFRNAGPGCYSPEWSSGAEDSASSFDDYRTLYREIAPLWIERGARIHALSVFASEAVAIEALSLTGFGRIVMDAAAPTSEVAKKASATSHTEGTRFRRAVREDAVTLAGMNARLAEHIGASPVLMPGAHGDDAEEWRLWLAEPDSVAFLAEGKEGPIGYIKAQDPQFDVSDAVHDPSCLAINGMYCDPSKRGQGIGAGLLSTVAGHATEAGKGLMSVDCETHNLEAYAFWTRFFSPVTWSFERRV